MPCLLGILAFFFPRFVIILLVIFGSYIGDAYQTTIWPLLGFFFAPFTTLSYALAINENGSVSGIYLVLVIITALMDLGVIGEGARKRDRIRNFRTGAARC